jgi:hypothetical protein
MACVKIQMARTAHILQQLLVTFRFLDVLGPGPLWLVTPHSYTDTRPSHTIFQLLATFRSLGMLGPGPLQLVTPHLH